MMDGNHPKRVQDYTDANMVMVFVNLIWVFGLIWSQVGFGGVLLVAAILNHAITWLASARRRHAKRMITRGKDVQF